MTRYTKSGETADLILDGVLDERQRSRFLSKYIHRHGRDLPIGNSWLGGHRIFGPDDLLAIARSMIGQGIALPAGRIEFLERYARTGGQSEIWDRCGDLAKHLYENFEANQKAA